MRRCQPEFVAFLVRPKRAIGGDLTVNGKRVTQRIRLFLFFEAATFVAAALAHAGVLIRGYEHRPARIAESIIALVLLAALVLSALRPSFTRMSGIAGQAFALAATFVGGFTIAIGIGPRTVPDILYHVAIVIVLVWGLVVAGRQVRAAH